MRHKGILILLVLLLCASPIWAGNPQIYIHNRLLSGEVIKKGSDFYVLGEELKKLLRIPFSWDESTGSIIIGEDKTTIKIMKIGNNVFVPIIAISRALGLESRYNEETEILDVYRKSLTATEPATVNPVQPSSSNFSVQPGQGSDDLLVIQEVSFKPDMLTFPSISGLRIFTMVTNGRFTRARNVRAQCVLIYPDGGVAAQQEAVVGDLEPGEKKEVLFYFPGGCDLGLMKISRSYSVKSD